MRLVSVRGHEVAVANSRHGDERHVERQHGRPTLNHHIADDTNDKK